MDTTARNAKLTTYFELQAQINRLQAQVDAIKQELRAEMEEAGETSRTEGIYKMQFITVNNSRLDTKELQRKYPQLVEQYTVVKPYTQFRVTKSEPKD